jgi:hypothetical protein
MKHVETRYPNLFDWGFEMAREGVPHAAAREIATEACVVAGLANAGDPGAPTARDVFARRVKRHVRELVLATHRARRRKEDRGEELTVKRGLPAFGWMADPPPPFAAWDMDEAIDDTLLRMPAFRLATLSQVRQDGYNYADVAAKRGSTVEDVAVNIAEALADLRAVGREGRRREAAGECPPDPELVLLGRWLANDVTLSEAKGLEDRFVADDAFYAKTAPVMQIWTQPRGMFGAAEVEEGLLAPLGRNISLITDYIANELSERDRAAVKELFKTDVAFYVTAKPILDIWRMEQRRGPRPAQPIDDSPEEEARKVAAWREWEKEEREEDPDLAVIREWLSCRLPRQHEKTVDNRLVSDRAFFEKVIPVMRIWAARSELLDRLGTEIGEGPVDEADPDVVLIKEYLAVKVTPEESRRVARRLGRDKVFARKVGPVVKGWRVPGKLG